QHGVEQAVIDLAAGGEGTVAIERLAQVALTPRIEQAVGRAGIEAAYAAVGGQDGDVGDAAEVEHGPRAAGCCQQHGMQRGKQRRTLSAGSTSARRKSATTSMRQRSAITLGSP